MIAKGAFKFVFQKQDFQFLSLNITIFISFYSPDTETYEILIDSVFKHQIIILFEIL